MDYLAHIGVLIAIYAILAASADILIGHSGIVSVCHAGFYGIGAYTAALLSTQLHLSFGIVLAIAFVSSWVVCGVLSITLVRLTGDYLVLGTLCIQALLSSVFLNWERVTGGAQGVVGVGPAALLGTTLDSPVRFFFLVVPLSGFVILLVLRITGSPFGRLLHAIREDELVLTVAGKAAPRVKLVAFSFAGSLAAFAGALYAYYARYVNPNSFGLLESVLIASIVIVGGPGRALGAVLGAGLLVGFPELLRLWGLPAAQAADIRQISYGLFLIVSIFVRLPDHGVRRSR